MDLKNFLHPYYYLNVLILLSYIPLRSYYVDNPSAASFYVDEGSLGYSREVDAVALLLFVLGHKMRGTNNVIVALDWLFLYGKTFIVGAVYLMDKRVFFWYLVFLFIMFFYEPFQRPTTYSKWVRTINTVNINSQLRGSHKNTIEKKKKKNKKKKDTTTTSLKKTKGKGNGEQEQQFASTSSLFHLVQCVVPWSDRCKQAEIIFNGLANIYGTKDHLRFGRLDLEANPILAKRYGIDTSIRTLDLPAYLLFRDGDLIRRLPESDHSGSTTYFEQSYLKEHFAIETLYASNDDDHS